MTVVPLSFTPVADRAVAAAVTAAVVATRVTAAAAAAAVVAVAVGAGAGDVVVVVVPVGGGRASAVPLRPLPAVVVMKMPGKTRSPG